MTGAAAVSHNRRHMARDRLIYRYVGLGVTNGLYVVALRTNRDS